MEVGMRSKDARFPLSPLAFNPSSSAEPGLAAKRSERKDSRQRSRRTIAVFVLATLAINGAVAYFLDEARPRLRDPEYARRISSLRVRIAENPNRPLVLVVGSSRTAMGIKPNEREISRSAKAASNDFLMFNLSLIGGGPVLELIVAQRAFAEGIKPAVLLVEYWPPLLNLDRDNTNLSMIDRMGRREQGVMQEHNADAASAPGRFDRIS